MEREHAQTRNRNGANLDRTRCAHVIFVTIRGEKQ